MNVLGVRIGDRMIGHSLQPVVGSFFLYILTVVVEVVLYIEY